MVMLHVYILLYNLCRTWHDKRVAGELYAHVKVYGSRRVLNDILTTICTQVEYSLKG